MNVTPGYHSCLTEELEGEPLDSFETVNLLAFVHDIRKGIPKQFGQCDVIYAEIPWKVGYGEFNRRAAVKAGSYSNLIYLIGDLVMQYTTPVYMTCGAATLNMLPPTREVVPIKLHGIGSFLVAYRAVCPPVMLPSMTNLQAIAWLAERYNCVGDFCCGYGTTGRIFKEAGKRAVLSDFNPKVIGRIAATCSSWTETNTKP